MFKKCSWYLIPSTSTKLSVYFNMALLSQEVLAWENEFANLYCFFQELCWKSLYLDTGLFTLFTSPERIHFFLLNSPSALTKLLRVHYSFTSKILLLCMSIFNYYTPHFAKYHSRSLHWRVYLKSDQKPSRSLSVGLFLPEDAAETLPSVQHCSDAELALRGLRWFWWSPWGVQLPTLSYFYSLGSQFYNFMHVFSFLCQKICEV